MGCKVAIFTDDFSGGNAIGAEFARRGLKTLLVQEPEAVGRLEPDVEVVVIDTESRYLDPAAAGERNRAAAEAVRLLSPGIVVKKTDSLLRGPMGAEIDAIADVFGFDRCLFVPAAPSMGRLTVGGYQLVNGEPLISRRSADDPTSAVATSHVPSILRSQSRRPVHQIELNIVEGGSLAVREALGKMEPGVIIADSSTWHDLNVVVSAARDSGFRFFAGSYGLGEVLCPQKRAREATSASLVIAGSPSEMTRRQIARAEDLGRCCVLPLCLGEDLFVSDDEALARPYRLRAQEALARGEDVVLCTAQAPDAVDQLRAAAKQRGISYRNIPAFLERMLQAVVEPLLPLTGGVVLSGGWTAHCVFKLLKATGVRLEGTEILPGTPMAHVQGGPFDGLVWLTKPGSFGTEDDLVTMLSFLKETSISRNTARPHRQGGGT
ncbi:four-carbon acid sugar kinase family protein [Aurantimonas sp. C2-5-R2]|uniref:four-carbon acid sugar kinase family protein n=1 Tax=Aurantimonas sp. C2-5-R2 TaxID=3113713 RepID=UPI002F94C9CF